MLSGIPIYHYFDNGNAYSGAEGGMRYLIEPGKRPDPDDPSGKKKLAYLTVTVWPEPWSLEHTADEKKTIREFAGSQQGLDEIQIWLNEMYTSQAERWADIPSILDCGPDC